MRRRNDLLLSVLCIALAGASVAATGAPDVADLVRRGDAEAIAARGSEALDEMAALYRRGSRDEKLRLANLFYRVGHLSPTAEAALLPDAKTDDAELRIAVQYALGRVSDDDEVVQTLLDSMRHDPSALIRDKAACALAYDQIHLSERQKVHLYAGLIQALADDVGQVRAIAIKALQIHAGQTKGYRPNAPVGERREAILRWQRWLLEYRRSL